MASGELPATKSGVVSPRTGPSVLDRLAVEAALVACGAVSPIT